MQTPLNKKRVFRMRMRKMTKIKTKIWIKVLLQLESHLLKLGKSSLKKEENLLPGDGSPSIITTKK
jgi:hypothetical protein